MKRVILTFVLLSIVGTSDAQVRKIPERENYGTGSFEAGLGTEIGMNTIKRTSSDNTPFMYNTEDSRKVYLNLNVSLGYYFLDGLSFEPELGLNLTFDEVSALVLGNISYTFNTELRTTFPYLKVGYGFTDIQNYRNSGAGIFESLNYKVINVGAGIKFQQSNKRAFKMEISYKQISGTDSYPYYYYDSYSNLGTSEIETVMSILSISFNYSFSF